MTSKKKQQCKYGGTCEFVYTLSTPRGDWYECIKCGSRVKEEDLIKK